MFQEVKSTTKNDNHQQEKSETENLKVVDFFHEQIVIKDEQLKEKDKQIEKLQSLSIESTNPFVSLITTAAITVPVKKSRPSRAHAGWMRA